jgi:hypothetical protein
MLITLLTLLACQDNIQKVEEEQVEGEVYSDADGDGYLDDEDCDDNNAQINPAMDEVCNGIDDNCDDEIDEGVGTTYYLDNDGDGYGMAGIEEYACEAPEGYVPTGSDCNDNNAASFPGGEEVCDGIDNDCDALIDDDDSSLDRSSGNTYFWDSDGAAFGALIFGTVSMGIFYTDVDTDWFKVFLGAMMLIAVVFNNFIRKRVTESK